MSEEVGEECGIAAVAVDPKLKDANAKGIFYLYKLLLNLQNRGQLSAGITTYDHSRRNLLSTYKNLGTVNEVFKTSYPLLSAKLFKRSEGHKGIGHTRYATCGDDNRNSAQPFERQHGERGKWFAFSFNGNLANYSQLKDGLIKKEDYHFVYDTDTEVIMHYLAKSLKGTQKGDLVNVFTDLSEKFDGCYNLAFINAKGEIVASRDPLGFRPLAYGTLDDGTAVVASETNALFNCGVKKNIFVNAGEMVYINGDKPEVISYAKSKRQAKCMFEYVYFANVSSLIDDRSVYITRTRLGKALAVSEKLQMDKDCIVVPVPDTAKPVGDAMAFRLGIPSKEGLIRNRFVGRTFIEGQNREDKIRNKFTVLRRVVKDKKVLLVDDSIVRGSTSRELVKYIKEVGGAKEVHLRIACPPIVAPCFYGIDMSTVKELFAAKYIKDIRAGPTEKELAVMAKTLGADSLHYNSIEALVRAIDFPKGDFCNACITGSYPTPCGKMLYQKALKGVQTACGPSCRRTHEA